MIGPRSVVEELLDVTIVIAIAVVVIMAFLIWLYLYALRKSSQGDRDVNGGSADDGSWEEDRPIEGP